MSAHQVRNIVMGQKKKKLKGIILIAISVKSTLCKRKHIYVFALLEKGKKFGKANSFPRSILGLHNIKRTCNSNMAKCWKQIRLVISKKSIFIVYWLLEIEPKSVLFFSQYNSKINWQRSSVYICCVGKPVYLYFLQHQTVITKYENEFIII